MKREENIFFNIIKNETSLTEVFCNLLNYKAFRNVFLNIVKNKNIDFNVSNVSYKNFNTELILDGDNGRSDLHLKANNTEYIFEIKIELYTDLTDNQPEGYLEYLRSKNIEDVDKNLFFILPRGYLHLKDIHRRWINESKYSKNEIDTKNIIYWDEILNEIKKLELDKLNLFISEFCKIMNYRWFKYEDIKFLQSEMELINLNSKRKKGYEMLSDTNIPSLINKLFKIVDSAYEKLYTVDKYDKQSSDYYGYILNNNKYKIPENWSVWFGVDFEIWSSGKSPLTIQIYSDSNEDIPKIQELFGSKKFEYQKETEEEEASITTYIELDKSLFKNSDKNITEYLVIKIIEIVNKIQK